MGIFDRIARIARAGITDLTDRPASPDADKSLGELSDKELEDEILRRRRDRAARRAQGLPDEAPREPAKLRTPGEQQIAQYYANLELPNGASLDDIKKAYREMMRRYHPDKHIGDPERHKASTELAQSITRAYTALVAHLGK
jgi:DnaJ-domain-containing protein 1